MMRSKGRLIVTGLLLGLVSNACLDLARQTPEKHVYAIQLNRPRQNSNSKAGIPGILKIRRFQISPMYASRNLLYRLSGNEYVSDFYNEFLIPPATNLANASENWLAESQLFSQVATDSSQLSADYILEGNIQKLYGDYSGDKPYAIMSIHYLLLENQNLLPRFNKLYEQKVELHAEEPAALIQAYHTALTNILQQLERDLSELPWPADIKK